MVRIYNDVTIDVVTMLQQLEPDSIKLTLKIYNCGTMWTGQPLAQRSLVLHSDTPSKYLCENSLPLILVTLFNEGYPQIQTWLSASNVPPRTSEKAMHFLGRSLLQMQRLSVA